MPCHSFDPYEGISLAHQPAQLLTGVPSPACWDLPTTNWQDVGNYMGTGHLQVHRHLDMKQAPLLRFSSYDFLRESPVTAMDKYTLHTWIGSYGQPPPDKHPSEDYFSVPPGDNNSPLCHSLTDWSPGSNIGVGTRWKGHGENSHMSTKIAPVSLLLHHHVQQNWVSG